MTDNGGGSPGNRGSEADADSWFKPSENRNRTQSEYQDPLDQEGASGGDAPAGAAVFPDSGGYSGLSASRPALVEPYPDLGGPPSAEQPRPVPGISYPGAGTSAYRPVTGVPGNSDPLAHPGESGSDGGTEEPAPTGGYPGIAASAQVPLPPEDPEGPSEPARDSWAAGTNDSWAPQPPAEAPAGPPETQAWSTETPEAARTSAANAPAQANDAWSRETPAPTNDTWLTGGTPAPAAESWTPQTPAADAWTPAAEDSWTPRAPSEPEAPSAGDPWTPQPAREQSNEWQGAGGLDSWSPAPDTGDDWKGSGTTEPWADPATPRWTEPTHTPSYGGDQYDDELSPRPTARPAEQYGDRYDELSSTPPPASSASDAVAADQGGIGSGSGNTWAFDRNDPRLPDVVRDAERRRRESAPGATRFSDWGTDTGRDGGTGEGDAAEQDGGPDTGQLSAAVAASTDPLAAIADMQSRARAKEAPEPEDELGPEPGQGWNDRPWDAPARAEATWDPRSTDDPAPSSWEGTSTEEDSSWRGGEGATQMFTAPSFDQAPGVRGYDELGYDDRGSAGFERGHDELGYDDRDHGAPAYGDRGYGEQGYGDQGYGEPGYDGQDYDDGDEFDGPADDRGPVAAGVPSDLGSAPSFDQGSHSRDAYGQGSGAPFEQDSYEDDPHDQDSYEQGSDGPDPDGPPSQDGAAEADSDYEDGFTPADYGMPERPRPSRRRRDRIAEDFPGFDDAADNGDYPGYDSIDFLADTEPGANVTLWLGVASLIPGIGVITAVLALFVTGPRAKKAIRESRGTLDGLGRITAGTVFAVLGIVVTVISVAIWLVL